MDALCYCGRGDKLPIAQKHPRKGLFVFPCFHTGGTFYLAPFTFPGWGGSQSPQPDNATTIILYDFFQKSTISFGGVSELDAIDQGIQCAFIMLAIHFHKLFGGPVWEPLQDHFLLAVFLVVDHPAEWLPAGRNGDVLAENYRLFSLLESHTLVNSVVHLADLDVLPSVSAGDSFCLIHILLCCQSKRHIWHKTILTVCFSGASQAVIIAPATTWRSVRCTLC